METKKFTMDCLDGIYFEGIQCGNWGCCPAFTKEVGDNLVEFWKENLDSSGQLLWYEHDENGGRYVEEWEGEREYYPAEVINGEVRYTIGNNSCSEWMWRELDDEE